MRILWLSPWLRPLARVQAEALQRRGHEVLLVTSDQHPESDTARTYEAVLVPSPRQPASWAPTGRALARARRFAPDVVLAELVRDPRWLGFGRGAPRLVLVHDDRPHDASERRPAWERMLFDRWARSAAGTVAFSEHVAAALRRAQPDTSVHVVPLASDLDDAQVPVGLVPAAGEQRRDIVLPGRLQPYKNLDVTLAAWARHVSGPGWRGDELVLLGAEAAGTGANRVLPRTIPATLPPHVRHVAGPYRYADVVPRLARAKATLVHYRQATQSGVQVLAMQLGTTPVVSPAGGLPELQPPAELPVGVDDVAGLAARLDELADPAAAAGRGAAARAHYERHHAADIVAAAWDELLTATRARAASRP